MEKTSHRLSRWAALGASVSALFGSCCALPILLLTLTGTVGFAASLVPYQKYFAAAAVVFLGVAFYLVYGRKRTSCAEEKACSLSQRRTTKILLWLAALLTAIFLIGPLLVA
jgi:mercuric ion transport protein